MAKAQKTKPDIVFDEQGHAKGWAMTVGRYYRQQLGIVAEKYIRSRSQKTEQLSDSEFLEQARQGLDVIDYYNTGTKTKNGFDRWAIKAWAQGPELDFDRGHFFAGKAGKRTANLTLQILEATPTNSNLDDPGTVRLLVSHAPDGPHNSTIPIGISNITQRELLQFLKRADSPLVVITDYDPSGAKVNALPIAELEREGLCVFKTEQEEWGHGENLLLFP